MRLNPTARKATTGRGNWADQVNDAQTVLGWRRKNGIKEEVELDEAKMSSKQIAALKKAYEPMRGGRLSMDNATKLGNLMDRFDKDKDLLIQLFKADIPFVSKIAMTRLISKHKMKGAEFYITQSWFNKTVPNKHHHSHMHPNSIISAVLYVEGPNCPTFFYNRDSFNNFTFFDKINGNPFTANKVGVVNEPGRLVLFPSYLHHEVDINKGNSDRYSISFNTFVKGDFGDYENLTELKI